jgi:hypothetical protein
MFCDRCGTQLASGVQFCANCGESVGPGQWPHSLPRQRLCFPLPARDGHSHRPRGHAPSPDPSVAY